METYRKTPTIVDDDSDPALKFFWWHLRILGEVLVVYLIVIIWAFAQYYL